jgi:uncharacterized membrane protein
MTRQEYIENKIALVKETMVSFQRWSIVLFIIAIVSILFSYLGLIDKTFSVEFLKYGLSSITTISGAAMQGVKYIRKNKLIELEYCSGIVEKYETLKDFDKIIVNKALDGILNK